MRAVNAVFCCRCYIFYAGIPNEECSIYDK